MGSFSLKSSPVGQSLSLSSRGSFVVGSLSLTGKEVKEAGGRRKSEGKKKERGCGIGRRSKGIYKLTTKKKLVHVINTAPLSNPHVLTSHVLKSSPECSAW